MTVVAAFPHYPHGRIPREYRWKPIKVEWVGKIRVIRTLMPSLRSEGFLRRLALMGSFAVSALFALPWIGRIDAVWAQSWLPGLLYARIKRVPIILNVDDLTIEDLSGLKLLSEESIISKVASMIYRIFYVKGDVIAPISPGYVSTISSKYCVDRRKIHVLRIGVDHRLFTSKPIREKSEKFRVIYAGVLGLGYDFEQIFQAAKILNEQALNVEFVIHGEGECLPLLRQRLKELKLTNVKLSDKRLPTKKDVVNLLSNADALILPIKDYGRPYLGLPTKLYEYQAVGKPIICCSVGTPSDYVTDTNSGLVVSPDDPEALAKAIVALKNDSELARKLGENGRRHVESKESIEAIGLETRELLEKLT